MSSHAPRFNKRVLNVFMLVGVPILMVGVWLVLAGGQQRLRDSYGAHLSQIAQQATASVDSHFFRKVSEVIVLGRSPTLRQAAAAANRTPLNTSEVDRLDAAWRADAPLPPAAASVLQSETSRYLRDISQHDDAALELLATDRHGRLIAASGRVSDYFQADEPWWQTAFDDGTVGRVAVSGVQWDDSARRHAIEISVPIPVPDGDAIGGVLKAVVDSREMLALIAGLRLGATGQGILLLNDGTVVFSPGGEAPGGEFFAVDAFRAHRANMGAGDPRRTAFFRAVDSGGEAVLIGIARSQLVESFPYLPWYVAVVQSEAELLAPVRALGGYLLAVFGLSAVIMLSLALWFSFQLAQSPASDLHLVTHAPVMHVGSTDEPILEGDERT